MTFESRSLGSTALLAASGGGSWLSASLLERQAPHGQTSSTRASVGCEGCASNASGPVPPPGIVAEGRREWTHELGQPLPQPLETQPTHDRAYLGAGGASGGPTEAGSLEQRAAEMG